MSNSDHQQFIAAAVLDSTTDGIITTDLKGNIKSLNKGAEFLYGYAADEIIGESVAILYPKKEHSKLLAIIEKLLKDEKISNIEVTLQNKNDKLMIIALSLAPIKNSKGEIIELLGISRDITLRKKSENDLFESELLKKTILNGITANIAFVNDKLEIIWANKTAADSVNMNAEDMIGQTCHKFWADPDKPCDKCPSLKAIQTKKPEHTFMYNPDGRVWDESGEPVFDKEGKLIGVVEIARDITIHKKIELELQESEKRYIAAEEIALMGNVTVNLQDRKSPYHFSPGFFKILGVNPDEVEMGPEAYLEFVHPEDREKVAEVLQKAKSGEEGSVSEHRIIKKDGTLRWMSTKIMIIKVEHGEPSKMVGIMQDITERRNAMEAITLKNKVFDASLAAQSISDTNGLLKEVNTSFLNMWGFPSKNDVIGKPISYFLQHKYETKGILAALGKNGFWSGEYIAKRGDGSTFNAYSTATVILSDNGELIGYQSSVIDITERKKVEEKLLMMNALSVHANEPIAIKDKNYRYIQANPVYIEKLSQKSGQKQIIGKDDYQLFPKETADKLREVDEKILLNSETIVIEEFLGDKIYLSRKFPIKDDNNNTFAVGLIATDITEQKKIQEELLTANNLIKSSYEALPGVYYLFDQNGHFIKWNKNFTDVTEYSNEEMNEINPLDLFEGEDRKHIQSSIMETFTKGETHVEAYFLTKSGKKIPYYFTGRLMTMNGKPYLVGMGIDITERKKYEKLYFQSQKIEAIGTLAGGIAHDFNNILMGILGNISLAKLKLSREHSAYKFLEESELSMDRATRLTSQLLTFSKGGEPIKEDTSLGSLVEDVTRFDLSGSNVKLAFEQSDSLWLVNVDKGQIQQVFSNLTINAKQAMPDGGVLHINLENSDILGGDIPGLNKGKYVKCTVRDNGIGINRKHIKRVFDPFFQHQADR